MWSRVKFSSSCASKCLVRKRYTYIGAELKDIDDARATSSFDGGGRFLFQAIAAKFSSNFFLVSLDM